MVALAIDGALSGYFFEAINTDQAFDENFHQFDEETEFLHGNNQRVVFLAETAFHELRGLPFHQFALGGFGAALGFGTFRCDFFELGAAIGSEHRNRFTICGAGSRRRCTQRRNRGIIERPFEAAMNDQVGIAPNRRSEMRVFLHGQRKMPKRVGGIARLLQRAQHQV